MPDAATYWDPVELFLERQSMRQFIVGVIFLIGLSHPLPPPGP